MLKKYEKTIRYICRSKILTVCTEKKTIKKLESVQSNSSLKGLALFNAAISIPFHLITSPLQCL